MCRFFLRINRICNAKYTMLQEGKMRSREFWTHSILRSALQTPKLNLRLAVTLEVVLQEQGYGFLPVLNLV